MKGAFYSAEQKPRNTTVAVGVVLVELGIISWIRHRFMDTPWASAPFQVALGGALVFLAGILIGNS
jgi:hypothetical protein